MTTSGRTLGNTDPGLAHCWHPVARIGEVTSQPLRIQLLGEAWVLHRAAGKVVAFADRCPHRQAPLSLGECEGADLRCAYHGWKFDSDGQCIEIPALGPEGQIPPRAWFSKPFGVEERHGLVFLAPKEPVAPLGTIEVASDSTFAIGELPSLRARASAGLLADNFLDMAHFPFVHRGTFGADESAVVPHYEVTRDGFSFSVSYEHSFANREDPGVAGGIRPLVQTRRLTYRLDAPFHLTLRIDFVEAGGANVIGFFLQPETDDSCRIYTTLWRNDLDGDQSRMQSVIDFEIAILQEDLAVQERYDRLELPLDPTIEVHTRADRTTVELRRVLTDVVEQAERLGRDAEPIR